jgi:hypothetical protein
MNVPYLVFLILALVLEALAAFGVGAPRFNLIAGGLASYFLALLFGAAHF